MKREYQFQLLLCLLLGILIVSGQPMTIEAEETNANEPLTQVLSRDNIKNLSRLYQIGKGEPHSIWWSPDGETVALTTGAGVYLFDGHKLQPLGILDSGYSGHLTFSSDSSMVALFSGPMDGQRIQIWNVKELRLVREIKQDRVLSALYIEQEKGELLALGQKSAGTDPMGIPLYKGYLDTYQLKTGKRKTSVTFQAANKQLMALSLCPSGRTIFMAGINEYNFLDFKGKFLHRGTLQFGMYAVGAANAGTAAFMNPLQPGLIQLINLKDGRESGVIPVSSMVADMHLDDTGEILQFYSKDGWHAYRLETGELISQVPLKGHTNDTRLSPLQNRTATIIEDQLQLVDIANNVVVGTQEGFLPRGWQVAVSGNALAALRESANGIETHLYELRDGSGTALNVYPQSGTRELDLAFSPDGQLLALLRESDTVTYLSAASGVKDNELKFEYDLSAVCISADFRLLMAGFGHKVEVWPTGSETPLMSESTGGFVSSVSLSTDGSRAAASDSIRVTVWDTAEKTRLMEVPLKDFLSARVDISPDGATLAAAFNSQKKGYTLKLYDIAKAKVLWTYALGKNFQELCFSPDGSLLAATCYEDGLIFINPKSGKRIHVLNDSVADLSFSPDGRLIATTSSSGILSVWGIP